MPFISPSRAFLLCGGIGYIPHTIERATRRDRGAGRVLYAMPFIMGLVLHCTGFYCVWGIPILPAAVALVYGRSMPFCGAFPLSFGCSLLTGARGAFNRVVFCVLAVLSRARNAIDSGRGAA